jgi:hypothetical protein
MVLGSVLVASACGGGQTAPPGPSTPEPSATATPSSPSPSASSPTPAEVFALHRYEAEMASAWHAPIVLPYGPDESQLGTSLGGDGEGVQWGPSYGTVVSDGTWWILDGAKTRFAHYDTFGGYLGQVVIPAAFLVDGRYMQWQRPLALADGTVVSFRMGGDRGSFLLLRDGELSQVDVDRQVVAHADDGELLYGFGTNGEMLAVDLAQGTVTDVDAFRNRVGVPYRMTRDGSMLRFELPGSGVARAWPQVAAETGGPAAGAISLVTTADGRFHVFVDGAADEDEGTGRSGFGVIDPNGDLTPTEPTRQPWSSSDDGTGIRLVARPGSNDVWFMAIDTDAIRLYQHR